MPWDEADRAKYEVIRDRYSTDMSDAEFELISPLLPAPKKLGRKPTDFRVVLNAVFYMIRVGCPWRLLPKDFPPFTTVQNRFYAWRDSGLWPQIISVFVMAAREGEGREPAPTAVVVDSQSVKTTEAGGPRGFEAGKKIKGRKRHVAVDTEEFLGHYRTLAGLKPMDEDELQSLLVLLLVECQADLAIAALVIKLKDADLIYDHTASAPFSTPFYEDVFEIFGRGSDLGHGAVVLNTAGAQEFVDVYTLNSKILSDLALHHKGGSLLSSRLQSSVSGKEFPP